MTTHALDWGSMAAESKHAKFYLSSLYSNHHIQHGPAQGFRVFSLTPSCSRTGRPATAALSRGAHQAWESGAAARRGAGAGVAAVARLVRRRGGPRPVPRCVLVGHLDGAALLEAWNP